MNYLIFKLTILCAIAIVCNGKISDQRLCGDADCANPVSYAKTLLRYSGDDPRILSFKPGEKVLVYSKSAGSRDDLWGVEINGKRGYAPKGLIREERVLTSTLNYLVATEPETAPHIASSVAPVELNAANPTELYEVVDGTTLYYDNVASASEAVNVASTAVPLQRVATPSPPQEKVEEHQEKVEAPQQTVDILQEKLEAPQEQVEVLQEEIKESQEKVEVPQEEIKDSQKQAVHQEIAENHQDKIENHQKKVDDDPQDDLEETQEEGSAQRIYKYFTSLLPSEGSGFLSSDGQVAEDQVEDDAGEVVDETPGSGEIDDEEPDDEINSEETSDEKESSEDLTDGVTDPPSGQPEVGQASNNTEAEVEMIMSSNDGNNVDKSFEEKQAGEVSSVTGDSVPESSMDNVAELTLAVDDNPVPASSLPDVHPVPVFAVPEPIVAYTVPDPVPTMSVPEPEPTLSVPEPVPSSADFDPASAVLEDSNPDLPSSGSDPAAAVSDSTPDLTSPDPASAVSDPIPTVTSPDSDPASAVPEPIPDLVLPDPVSGSEPSPVTRNDLDLESLLATVSPTDTDHTDQIADTTSTFDPDTVPTPDPLSVPTPDADTVPTPYPTPNIYPNPYDFFDSESVGDPNNNIEKTEESYPSHIDTPLDHILDKLQLSDGAEIKDTLFLSVEDVNNLPSVDSTLEPNNNDVEMPSDHEDETLKVHIKDEPSQLPWDMSGDTTTEIPVHEQLEKVEVVTSTETPSEEVSSTENSPGFLESIMNMFTGSASPPDDVAENVAGPDDDEAMQGDQPFPSNEDNNEDQAVVSEDSPWWMWNPFDIVGKVMNEDSAFLEPSGSYNGILTIAITAMAVLVFTLGYYRIENSRQDSAYVGKINKLEKALYVSTTECLQLREEMEAASSQATSRFHDDEEISRLQDELDAKRLACQDFEERISVLNAELDAAMDTGEELNRMLSDYLADNQGTGKLRESVDSLQEQLANQQSTISATNTLIFNKNMENDLLRNEVAMLKDKLEKMKYELRRSTETCAHLRDESMQQREEWARSHEEELLSQKSEVTRLETIVSDLIEKLKTSESEITIMQECVQKINHGDSLQDMLDLGRVTARLENTTKQCETMSEQLAEEVGARKLLEDHLRVITQEIVVLTKSNAQAEKEKTEAITKLDILTNYFKEKEAQLQKDIDMHEALFKQKSGDAESMYSHMKTLQEQANHSKSQIEMLKKECDDQERSLKEQIFVAETKAHENWVAARQSERKCEEMKQEAAILRNRLTIVETQLAKTNQMIEHPPIVNDRVPIEGNGDMHMSPHHMQYMDLSYSPRPYMPPPLYEPDERLPPLGCLPTAPLPPPPAYSRPRHYETGFRPLPPQNRSRRTGSNSSGHSSGSIEKPGSRKQFDS